MTVPQMTALLPLSILATGILILLLQLAFFRNHKMALSISLLTLLAATGACVYGFTVASVPIEISTLLKVDRYSLFFCLLIFFTTGVVALLGFHYLAARIPGKCKITANTQHPEEFYVFLLLATLGASTLVSSDHFATFILALELISLALYPLLAFPVPFYGQGSQPQHPGENFSPRERILALESGIKYLVTSALASALLLFGVALIYAATGSLEFSAVNLGDTRSLLLPGGFAFLVAGIAFKLSLVPFHLWTADVYEGAPTPVTAFIATLGKSALLAILLKLFNQVSIDSSELLLILVSALAAASMLVGNLLALQQPNIKRLLAYSAIAHMGYLMVAYLVVGKAVGQEAVLYYLVAYTVTTLCAFAVVSLVSDAALTHVPGGQPSSAGNTNPVMQRYFRGLLWRAPFTALCFAAALLSLAGIPLTIGFVGKFYLITAAVEKHLWGLIGVLIVGSALGLFYYLRILLTLVERPAPVIPAFSPGSDSGTNADAASMNGRTMDTAATSAKSPLIISYSGLCILFLLTGLLLLFGIYPQLLINGINALYT